MKSYILNCFAIVLLLECSCVFTATIKPQTATQPGCDDAAINMCLKNISTTIRFTIFSVLQDVDTKLDPICRMYEEAKSCMLPLLAGNSCAGMEGLGFRSIIYGFDYICSDKGKTTMSNVQPCFARVETVNGMKKCAADVTNIDLSDLCSLPRHFISCSLNLTKMYCNLPATRAMKELMTNVFHGYTEEFNCVYSLPGEVKNTTPAAPISPVVTFKPTDCLAKLQTCLALLTNFSMDNGLGVFCGTFKEIIGCMNKTVDECKDVLPNTVDIRDRLIVTTQQLKSVCLNASTSSSVVTPYPFPVSHPPTGLNTSTSSSVVTSYPFPVSHPPTGLNTSTSSSIVTSYPFPVSHPPTGCSIGSLAQCLQGLSPILPWQQGSPVNIDLTAACRSFESVGDCYRKASASCPSTPLHIDILVSMYEYVCTPTGKQNFISLAECFKKPVAISAMGNCSDLSNLNLSDPCSIPNHFITCSVNVAKEYCAPATMPAIKEIINAAFQPYAKTYNCDLIQENNDSGNGAMTVFTGCWTLLSMLLLFVSNI